MPGRHIPVQQRNLFMSLKDTKGMGTAAARSGFSRSSGYRVAHAGADWQPPREHPRRGRRRPDPLAGIFDEELVPRLEGDSSLRACDLYEKLLEDNPELGPGVRRTLERRVRAWKLAHGPDQEVFFRQEKVAGRQGISDFTSASSLGITLAGEPPDHLLYHFRMPWSGFAYVEPVLGGESFARLSQGLEHALWELGGVPEEHRTDSLSAAFRNLAKGAREDLTERYRELCDFYGMEPTRNNRGMAHENGAIESPHGHLKKALAAALTLRGSRDFESLEAYCRFLAEIVARANARRRERIDTERKLLRPLPAAPRNAPRQVPVSVGKSGGFVYDKVFYTVPSRLKGHRLKARVYPDRLELVANGVHLETVPRVRYPQARAVINYRHVIGSLKKKPMALARWIHRDGLFPREEYRICHDMAREQRGDREACRLSVKLLALAHEANCEAALAEALRPILEAGQLPDADKCIQRFAPRRDKLPQLQIRRGRLEGYAALVRESKP